MRGQRPDISTKIGETNVKRIHRLGLIVLILISCTGCDQMTKNIAKESLASSSPISLLNDSIRVEYTENPGAILGLGANLPSEARFLFLVVFASLVLAITLVFAVNTHSFSLMQLVGLSLVTAGGIGNLLDRLFNNGAAIDFIRLGIGPLQTGIFNMADVAIVIGVVTFLLFSAKGKKAIAA
jgi:signal peptidase II